MAAETILKVSVLANGGLLLDGNSVTLDALSSALAQGAKNGAAVWYYRENASGEPPAGALDILKLITGHRMPVRLCAQRDFSDTVAPGTSPLAQLFDAIRLKAQEGSLVIVRPDGRKVSLPARGGLAPAEAIAAVERLLPSKVKRNVAVLADTVWAMDAEPGMNAANQAIPFFGMLLGFGAIGHAVWIFDFCAPAALAAGCKDADIALVDSGRLPKLPPDWQSCVRSEMRGSQILVHDRATYQLRKP
jgi:hypothetical protein